MFYRALLKMSFLPPLLNILIVLFGLLLMRRYRRLGVAISLIGLLSLYGLSTYFVSSRLLASIEVAGAVTSEQLAELDAENTAIVVLGTGHSEFNREYGSPWPDQNALRRLNYAAVLQRKTALPLMTTGGQPHYSVFAHADVANNYLERIASVKAKWLERESRTTWENAVFAKRILGEEGINTVVLVTESVHMRRSIMLFQEQGFKVVPAPTHLSDRDSKGFSQFVPSPKNLTESYSVMHELLGYAWYRLQGLDLGKGN
jgi:uncharacterized SAM-binding protein YcdF (DUF218 family)